MRTSIDIPDRLFARVRQVARRRKTTLRALMLEGLDAVTRARPENTRFRLRDMAFGDGGLVDGLAETDWDRIRNLGYGGRSG